eukprot:symbB.v1.2.023145.t1/scaffold2098.1/size89601/6
MKGLNAFGRVLSPYSWAGGALQETQKFRACRLPSSASRGRPQELSNMIYALGLLHCKAPELLHAACAQARTRTSDFSGQDREAATFLGKQHKLAR